MASIRSLRWRGTLGLFLALQLGASACKADRETRTPTPEELAELEALPVLPKTVEDDTEQDVDEAAERIAMLERAEQDRARFIDPELVRAVQARSGLIEAPPPDLKRLLHHADFREVMRYTGPLQVVDLPGQPVSSDYNAVRFAMGQELGCSLQRWDFISRHALDLRFDQYGGSLFEPVKEARTDAAAVYSTFAGLRAVVLKHSASRSMIQLTCTASMMSEPQLRELSERVSSRL